ncbi:hypothetical protein F4775DRAFT_578485 [Biscogniauxia sp. FL1348]|nr:hypothetical protein F4775DRAFT_578485 [Biscogniauxia sp. FL1348]
MSTLQLVTEKQISEMVTTRSQDKNRPSETEDHEPRAGEKRPHSKAAPAKTDEPVAKQREGGHPHSRRESRGHDVGQQQKTSDTGTDAQASPKIAQLISKYGALPLSDTALSDPDKATPDTVLALLLNALLSSTRISHALAAKTITVLVQAGYHKLDVLEKSTWEERTEVLTEGGYTRYREKTATMMGDLAELIKHKYGGDLNAIPQLAGKDPHKIRSELKNIKGLGDVGINIFFDTVQHVWPCVAPFVDPRSLETAEEIGIGGDVHALWKAVSEDPGQMCRLAAALTRVRLDGKGSEFAG